VSREVWSAYTSPERQKRRRERGLPPSVVIGTVTQKITPFRALHRDRYEVQRFTFNTAYSRSGSGQLIHTPSRRRAPRCSASPST